jgi:cytochrome c oxidase subunit II
MTSLSASFSSVAALLGPIRPKVPPSPYFWMPPEASTGAGETDWLFHVLMWISVVSLALIVGAILYFIVKYRARPRSENFRPEKSPDHNTTLEITWSFIPLVIVIALFVWGFKGFIDLHTPPQDAYDIRAQGQKWKWLFTYSNGLTDDTLHVPLNKPVRIIINSVDVIHSLYIPVFRVKQDAVPGRYTELWFQPDKLGTFPVECAEYCGQGHSSMLSEVVVQPEAQFKKWLADEAAKMNTMSPAALGKQLFDKEGCSGCHTTDGTIKVGPSWKGIYGKPVLLSTGKSVMVDDNYIRESILDPQAKIVEQPNGTPFPPVMPTFKGKLNDKQITGLIEYIKSLK